MSIIEIKVTHECIEPAVTRTLQVPGDIRLDCLHLTLQAAMGWTNSHLYMFEAEGATSANVCSPFSAANATLAINARL
jgi:hypothetical protein